MAHNRPAYEKDGADYDHSRRENRDAVDKVAPARCGITHHADKIE